MLFSTLPVLPLILYCSFSSKVIKSYSGRCQESKQQINGLTGTLLLLLGVGGTMVIQNEITIGIFYIFINLSGNVSGFLQNMPNIYAGFRQFSAAMGRLEKKLVL